MQQNLSSDTDTTDKDQHSGKNSLGLKAGLLIALISLGFSIGLIELALRVVGFSYRLYPEKIEFGWPNPTAMQNHYEPDQDLLWVPKDYSERIRRLKEEPPAIIFTGDSCTEFGTYDTFFKVHAERAGIPPFKAEKLGVGGWSSYQGLQQLKRDIAPIRPKIVTIYFGWNDHWIGFGIQDKEIAKLRSPLYSLLEHSRLTQLVTKAALSHKVEGRNLPLRVEINDFESNMSEMVATARSAGIIPVLLTAPSSHRVGKEPEYLRKRHMKDLQNLVPLHNEYVGAVRRVASSMNAPLCDLFADFSNIPEEELIKRYFNKDGIHLTKGPGEGYDKLAEFLVGCFEKHGLMQHLAAKQ
jgi:lysophospholipase L1-like esterase